MQRKGNVCFCVMAALMLTGGLCYFNSKTSEDGEEATADAIVTNTAAISVDEAQEKSLLDLEEERVAELTKEEKEETEEYIETVEITVSETTVSEENTTTKETITTEEATTKEETAAIPTTAETVPPTTSAPIYLSGKSALQTVDSSVVTSAGYDTHTGTDMVNVFAIDRTNTITLSMSYNYWSDNTLYFVSNAAVLRETGADYLDFSVCQKSGGQGSMHFSVYLDDDDIPYYEAEVQADSVPAAVHLPLSGLLKITFVVTGNTDGACALYDLVLYEEGADG